LLFPSDGDRPTPTKASAPNNHGNKRRGRTVANLITKESSNPAATIDMPVSAR